MTDFAGTPHGMAVVTRRGSIYLVSPSACEVTERINDICVENQAIPDMVYTMMYDRDGLLWVYNTERLWVLDIPRRRWLSHRLPQEGRGMIVKSVAQDNDGRVWLGRDHHGLEIVSKHSDRIDFHEMLDSANLSESSSVTAVCDDGSGTLWLGTYKRECFTTTTQCINSRLPRAAMSTVSCPAVTARCGWAATAAAWECLTPPTLQ